jgi:hypothetical protein
MCWRPLRHDHVCTVPEPKRFRVGGPFKVPTRGDPGSRALDRKLCSQFWAREASDWGRERGCYVFALRRGQGYRPLYVGKTTRSFDAECFGDRNYRLLHEAMDGERGALVLFLLRPERTRGRFNGTVVGDLEKFLVETALDKNPRLKNRVYARRTPGFTIFGVHRSGAGNPGRAASEFKRALGFRSRR